MWWLIANMQVKLKTGVRLYQEVISAPVTLHTLFWGNYVSSFGWEIDMLTKSGLLRDGKNLILIFFVSFFIKDRSYNTASQRQSFIFRFNYTEWSKSHVTHAWHMFYLPKNKLHWNQKTKKQYYVKFWSTAFSDACIHYFPLVWCNPGKSFSHGNDSPDEILSIFLAQENRKWMPKLILASYVRTRCQAVFENKHSLRLWERHLCTSTVERQLTDLWQHDVTCVGSCDHNDNVRLLIYTIFVPIATVNKHFIRGCVISELWVPGKAIPWSISILSSISVWLGVSKYWLTSPTFYTK
jgi:hypothetical protein